MITEDPRHIEPRILRDHGRGGPEPCPGPVAAARSRDRSGPGSACGARHLGGLLARALAWRA